MAAAVYVFSTQDTSVRNIFLFLHVERGIARSPRPLVISANQRYCNWMPRVIDMIGLGLEYIPLIDIPSQKRMKETKSFLKTFSCLRNVNVKLSVRIEFGEGSKYIYIYTGNDHAINGGCTATDIFIWKENGRRHLKVLK